MPSLLETACALQHNLVQALPPHPHPHPLALASTSPLESIAHLRQTVQRTVRQLRAGLAQFPAAAGGADRYLTQLKDAAASEAQLVALWGRDLKPRREITTLQVLEHIASDLNLVTFRDHDDQDDDDDATTPVTLSLGGKLMVVDVTASSARSHHIQRVKVAYVVKGLDKLSILAATRLEHLFATSDEEDEEDVDVREEREQARWKGIRRILSELKDLDEMADRTGRDTFQELELLNANLEKAFSHNKKDDNRAEPAGASATSMIPAKDRLLLQPRDSLYPIVIYHGTPFAQLGRHWARLLSSSSSSSSLSRFEIMEALLGECGGGGDPPAVGPRRRSAGGNNNNNIYAVQLELGPPPLPAVPEAEPESQQSPPPTTTTTTTAAKEEVDRPAGSSSLFLARLIPSTPSFYHNY
ncbi:hypothetical protein B0A53_01849 [Rhodotorula sp. CCFEE 5036]|nr:hypothetical protein B0A53_01849 [Rhodotorula sp. CCFEE 5036]